MEKNDSIWKTIRFDRRLFLDIEQLMELRIN